jgi:cell division protein ZapA (FtsZ GTPase activity inhibitor)
VTHRELNELGAELAHMAAAFRAQKTPEDWAANAALERLARRLEDAGRELYEAFPAPPGGWPTPPAGPP